MVEFSEVVTLVFKRQEESGKSVTNYAIEMGVSYTTLYKWKQAVSSNGSKGTSKPEVQVLAVLANFYVEKNDKEMQALLFEYAFGLFKQALGVKFMAVITDEIKMDQTINYVIGKNKELYTRMARSPK